MRWLVVLMCLVNVSFAETQKQKSEKYSREAQNNADNLNKIEDFNNQMRERQLQERKQAWESNVAEARKVAEMREWKIGKQKVECKMLFIENKQIYLDGPNYAAWVPINKLSAADQKWVKEKTTKRVKK